MFETQGVLGRSRQVGSVPEVTAIERTQRGSKHFASLRSASCSKPRATRQEPLKKVQGGSRDPCYVAIVRVVDLTIGAVHSIVDVKSIN